ncbi:hypothetical protein KQ945_08700 [Bacillus subtilis subsp. subtilis]|nr:hypothetical protein [Bacillus subtilis subsp. subtilis]
MTLMFNDGESARAVLQREQIQEDGRLRLPGVTPPAATRPAGTFGPTQGQVVYLESDGKGGQRVCRVEQWESRTYSPLELPQAGGAPGLRRDAAGKVRALAYRVQPAQERNPILAKLAPHYFMTRVDAFYHSADGRLVEARMHETPEIIAAANHAARTVVADRLTFCARYDAQGRLTMTSGRNAPVSLSPGFQCGQVAPGMAEMSSYRYYPDGTLLANLRTPGPVQPDDDAAPRQAQPRGQGNVWFNGTGAAARRQEALFNFIPDQGLYTLATGNMTFASFDAQPLYKERTQGGHAKLQYDFPLRPVPLTVIDDGFATLERYPRVRTYPHRSGLQVLEIFDANRRAPRQRQWRTLDLSRQETYNAKGALVQVVHYGAAPRDAYPEDLKRYAQSGVLKLTPTTNGYASYRVYDYDAAGEESLVFVCWQHDVPGNKPYRHFPWWTPDPAPKRSKEEALIYGMKNVANYCGTPDGKVVVQGLSAIDSYMAKHYDYGVEKLSYDAAR